MIALYDHAKNYLSVDPMDKNNTKKQNNVKDIRTRILKSFFLFMMDVLFAAGILGAYYYFTYRAEINHSL